MQSEIFRGPSMQEVQGNKRKNGGGKKGCFCQRAL